MSSHASQKDLQSILMMLRLLKPGLHDFVRDAWPHVEADRFIDGRHIRILCNRLEHAAKTQDYRCVINVPPGHMKSLLCNVFFPAWVWGPLERPTSRFFYASYTQELSIRDSGKCRVLLESDWYKTRWPFVELRRDENRKTSFENTLGGWRLATSIGGRGTGMHPDFIMCDDPHNVKQSESDVERRRALDWWDGTMSTRGRIRGARQIIIMQRLHEEDLSGHVLAKGGWDHVCLPMWYEREHTAGGYDWRERDGELLWPEAFSERVARDIEKTLGHRRAIGQLQQRPSAPDGEIFKREWFNVSRVLPLDGTRTACRYWDKAGTADGGDYTCGVLVVRMGDTFYVADVVRGQWSSADRERIIRATAEQDAARFQNYRVAIEQEPGSGGKESAELSVKNLAGFSVRINKKVKSKEVEWEPYAVQVEAGGVRLVAGEWNGDFIDEHLAAPFGKHDDQIDAACGAFRELALSQRVNLEAWA